MQLGIAMTDAQEEEKSNLNNDDSEINKGVELLLRNRRREEPSKTFQVKFCIFNREVTFYMNIKKKD